MKKSRGLFLAGNWKMNIGPEGARQYVRQLAEAGHPSEPFRELKRAGKIQVAVFVPAISLQAAREACIEKGWWKNFLDIGAQNAHFEPSGAFTGELSGVLLREIDIPLVLVGHSERRQYFGETNESAGRRMASLLLQGFQVLFCYGETRMERETGKTQAIIYQQLHESFQAALDWATKQGTPLLPDHWSRLSLAYEPVWAIGTGLTATPAQAQEAHALSRDWLKKTPAGKAPPAETTRILYGGSVTPENFQALLEGPDVDGGLVGGASLKPESFFKLIEIGAHAI